MEYFKRYTGTESVSIVNALAEMGENSSYANRKLIAAANGIADYSGTATQNLMMLSLLKDGKLIKPGTDAPAQPENTAEPTKQGFGRKVLIGALVLGAGIAAYKMFGNDEPKTATKKSAKKSTKKSAKKNSRKGLNGVNCSYYTNESSGVSIVSDNRKEFKQMLKDYAAKHPTVKAGGVAFMRHKNGNEEIMYGFSMRDGVVVFEPRIGNKKFLNGTKKSKFEKNVDELRNILLRSQNVDEAKRKAEAKGWKCKKTDYSGFDALKARKGLTVCEVFCEMHGSIARWHNIQMVQNTKTTPIEGL